MYTAQQPRLLVLCTAAAGAPPPPWAAAGAPAPGWAALAQIRWKAAIRRSCAREFRRFTAEDAEGGGELQEWAAKLDEAKVSRGFMADFWEGLPRKLQVRTFSPPED